MIKRLARCIREYKWPAVLSPLCMVGEVAMEVVIPLVMADLYDYGIVAQNMQTVVLKSLQLVLCALASLVFGAMSATFAAKAGTGFAKNLRHDMYHHVQDYSFANIDKFSTASGPGLRHEDQCPAEPCVLRGYAGPHRSAGCPGSHGVQDL